MSSDNTCGKCSAKTWPTTDLKALAKVSRFLRKPEVRERLRAARGQDGLIAVFEAPSKSDAA
jgi:mannitol/fructose-specific phosphotransferase system IIA component (Ntr-type)